MPLGSPFIINLSCVFCARAQCQKEQVQLVREDLHHSKAYNCFVEVTVEVTGLCNVIKVGYRHCSPRVSCCLRISVNVKH